MAGDINTHPESPRGPMKTLRHTNKKLALLGQLAKAEGFKVTVQATTPQNLTGRS